MNRDPLESGTNPSYPARSRGRLALRAAIGVLVSACVGAVAVLAGSRLGRSAVVDIGPTDGTYVRDFRDIERDGPAYFRWSSVPTSRISVPVRFCGPGAIRLRVRRHFEDPALLTVSLAGVVVGQRPIQARTDHPYETVEFPVSEAICTSDVEVLLESLVTNARPLGVAVDWMEIRSVTGFRERPATLVRGAIFLGLSALAVGFAGGGLSIVLGINAVLATILCTVFAADPVAGERILRGGVGAMALALILGLLIGTAAEIRALSRRARITLVVVTLLTLVSRAAFFHPQAFYPDYRVHALVQQTMDRLGLGGFLDHLFEIQYARSLGLQQIEGRWYPFPYPPGSYVITNGVSDLLRMDALDSSIVTAVVAASLIPLLTAAMGMALGLGEFASVAGALFVALQPLLVRRMALGYFPGLIGQLGDALSMVLLVKVLHSSSSATRPAGVLAGALLGAFLVYTQSIVNFGLFVATLLLLELGRRSLPTATTLRIAFAAALALSISMGVFYLRYLPVLENVTAHRPQPESRVLDRLEQIRQTTPDANVPEVEDLNDSYAGSTINPGRGLARLGSRLWRFNGPFSLAIGVGVWLLLRAADRRTQNMVLAWGAVAVWISLLSAGLPSPNGFQHLKDLEFVAPLLALAMGILAKRLWDYRPALALALGGSWLIFAAREFATEFSERLLPMSGL